MAAVANDPLTNSQILSLARIYSFSEMQKVALGYLDIDDVEINHISFREEDSVLINSKIIRLWANKNFGNDYIMVRTTNAK